MLCTASCLQFSVWGLCDHGFRERFCTLPGNEIKHECWICACEEDTYAIPGAGGSGLEAQAVEVEPFSEAIGVITADHFAVARALAVAVGFLGSAECSSRKLVVVFIGCLFVRYGEGYGWDCCGSGLLIERRVNEVVEWEGVYIHAPVHLNEASDRRLTLPHQGWGLHRQKLLLRLRRRSNWLA